jgi:hypothetical protein
MVVQPLLKEGIGSVSTYGIAAFGKRCLNIDHIYQVRMVQGIKPQELIRKIIEMKDEGFKYTAGDWEFGT